MTRKQIGYACLGRTMKFESGRHGFQGDAEKPNLLFRLAKRNPDVDWIVIGHNDIPWSQRGNIVNSWHNARAAAEVMPPRANGYYRTPFAPYWTGKPSYWCSEVSGFEDWLVEKISQLDGMVIHVGQHAPTQIRIPQAKNTWHQTFTDPNLDGNRVYDSMQSYCRYLIRGLNALGDVTLGRAPVAWLVPDPRNYLKARDVKWPLGTDDMLAQHQFNRSQRHERFGDYRSPEALGFRGVKLERQNEVGEYELWSAQHRYRHCDLELMILPDDWEGLNQRAFEFRVPVGIATTSTKASVLGEGKRRSQFVREYLVDQFPDAEVYGKWDAASLADVPEDTVRDTRPEDFFDVLNRFRVTLSLPIVDSDWSVAKPYQCWAAGTVCCYAAQVDAQGWTLPSRRQAPGAKSVGKIGPVELFSVRDDWRKNDLILASWLRVEDAAEFQRRASFIASDDAVWTWVVRAQLDLLKKRWDEALLEETIERKMGIERTGNVELVGVDAGAPGGGVR